MARRTQRPSVSALHAEVGKRVGKGQDNLVQELNLSEPTRLAQAGQWVVKVSHETATQVRADKRKGTFSPQQSAELGASYKKNKYEILKHFLGDYIPDSLFLASTVEQGDKVRPAEITLQRMVPNVSLGALNQEQRHDRRLQINMLVLLQRLQYMYSVVGESNARTSQGVVLDTKLDLGTISDYVRGESLDYQFANTDAQKAIDKISAQDSPNMLVDPETMKIYCIDFDQGDWTEGMDEAKELVFDIDAHRLKIATDMAHLALQGYFISTNQSANEQV